MDIKILPANMSGKLAAVPSKSDAHRVIIGSALSQKTTTIPYTRAISEDIQATINCLNSIGADIKVGNDQIKVTPIDISKDHTQKYELDCNESGTTLRFLLSIASALGGSFQIKGSGRLPERPLSHLISQLKAHGMNFSQEKLPMTVTGNLTPGKYEFPGDVSSQYISGLLMALPLLDKTSTITMLSPLQSSGYVDMTIRTLSDFGIKISSGYDRNKAAISGYDKTDITNRNKTDIGYNNKVDTANQDAILDNQTCPGLASQIYEIHGNQTYVTNSTNHIEGDWSNAAFWLCAGALSHDGITVEGLDMDSLQRDKDIIRILESIGADISISERSTVEQSTNVGSKDERSAIEQSTKVRFIDERSTIGTSINIKRNTLQAIELDASQIPDLVPVIAAVLSVAEGTSIIKNAGRLRDKESDRLHSAAVNINALGGNVKETNDGLEITGRPTLKGGTVKSFKDHRNVMSMAILNSVCNNEIIIEDAHAVNKSYPDFFGDMKILGGEAIVIQHRK